MISPSHSLLVTFSPVGVAVKQYYADSSYSPPLLVILHLPSVTFNIRAWGLACMVNISIVINRNSIVTFNTRAFTVTVQVQCIPAQSTTKAESELRHGDLFKWIQARRKSLHSVSENSSANHSFRFLCLQTPLLSSVLVLSMCRTESK